jgi:VanZ family protein
LSLQTQVSNEDPECRIAVMSSTSRHRRERDRDRRVFTPRRVRRIEGAALLLIATIGVILATLRPTEGTPAHLCVVCGAHASVDAIVNILLFVPIGAGLALLGVRWRTAIMIGAAATILVETLQLALPLGRSASISDLLTNTLGTAVGYYLSEHRRAIAYPRSRAALRYAIGLGLAWLVMLTATAVALLPSIPEGGYIAQWQPALEPFDRFTGRVSSAHLSGVTTPNGRVTDSERLWHALRQGVRVEATIEPGGAPRRVAPIVRVTTVDSAEVLLLAQRRDELLFRSRVLGTAMRLATPTVAMPDAVLPLVSTERGSLIAGGRRERGQLRVGALGGDAILELHAGAGWLLLLPPASALQASADLLSGVWVGLPLFAAAYWTGRRARRRARRAGDAMRMRGAGGQILLATPVLLGVAVIGLAGISALFGLSQPSKTVWLGAVLGIGSGLAVGASLALSRDDRTHGSPRHDAKGGETVAPAPQTANV